jgi:hypothetical protein
MAYENLYAAIEALIYQNGNNEIDANKVKAACDAIISTFAEFQYGGIIKPASTFTKNTNQKWFFLAADDGEYTNYGGVILESEFAVIQYDSVDFEKNTLLDTASANVVATNTDMEEATNDTKFVSPLKWIYAFGYHVINKTHSGFLTTVKTIQGAINELKTYIDLQANITNESTGFRYPDEVIVSYNGTTRKITLTGNTECYYKGVLIAEMVSGWESAAHDVADGGYFLSYDGTFNWTIVSWKFSNVQIAMVYRDGANFCLRECHGLMQWQSHEETHDTIGTYLKSGGDFSGFTLNSETAANRRPFISQTVIKDEDLPTTLAALSTNAYTWLFLSGAAISNTDVDNTDIISLSTNQPYYNSFSTTWGQTLMSNNQYAKIFVMAIPVTADADCQKSRFVFIQPQTANTNLATIQAVSSSSVNLGHISAALAEYCFIGEIIIRYTGGNWKLIEVNKLTGTKRSQTASPAGSFLTGVTTNQTLKGSGTATSPLGYNNTTIDLGTTGGAIPIDASLGVRFVITINANTTFELSNMLDNTPFCIEVKGAFTAEVIKTGYTFTPITRDTYDGSVCRIWLYPTSTTEANVTYNIIA